MDLNLFSMIVGLGSIIAGFFGALTGLGGGIVIVPLLTLFFGVDVHYAIGASLVSIIATSCGSAGGYVKQRLTNLRVAMFLGIATTIGAIVGALVAIHMPTDIISIVFGTVILISVIGSWARGSIKDEDLPPNTLATKLKLNGSYPSSKGEKTYNVQAVPGGFTVMFIAGALSGLLGIGSGVVKVLALDSIMRIPFRVSTATSSLMIGVTAAASAGLYLTRGYIDPTIAMPVMLGVLLGAFIGARVMRHIRTKLLRQVFSVIVIIISTQMIIHGFTQ